jgi:peptidoglycan/LPS O-acetylase OafA/YrhL
VTVDTKVPRFFLRLPLLQRLDTSRPEAKVSRNAQRREESRRRHAEKLSTYLPGLDGLRALAVIAVLLYHARPEWLPGGFLGVEVFFVISGFIITRGLLQEWQESGRIELRAFWLRRARRLLPALFLLLAGVMAYAAVFETDAVADLRTDVLAALAYVTNWHLILGDHSYFASFEKPSLLLHLWSLAIEEQFYLMWPLLLAGLLPLLRKKGTFVLIAGGIIASTVAMAAMYQPGADTSRLYYGTDTRAAGLLCGAALAFLLSNSALGAAGRSYWQLTLAGLAGLAGLGVATYFITESSAFLYQGGFLAVSLLSALLILGATRVNPLGRVLGIVPLRWVGARSYGIYLWHWPIFLLVWPAKPGFDILAAQVVATVVIAALSYELVEMPVRRGALARIWSDLRTWGSLRPGYQSGLILGANASAAVVAVLVIVGVQAKSPQQPDYFALDGLRIQSSSLGAATEREPRVSPVSDLLGDFNARPATRDELTLSFACQHSLQPGLELAAVCGNSDVVSVAISDAEDVAATVTSDLDDALALAAAVTSAPLPPKPQPKPIQMPPVRVVPSDLPRITAVGDSVMMGAAAWLAGNIPNLDLDSQVGRQASAAIALLQDRLEKGELGQIVLVHIGNNGSITDGQFEQIMAIAGPDRQVIFLNTRVPRDWQDSNNAVLSGGAQRHANMTLVDWYSVTEDHPELFAKDRIHLNGAGAELYTRLVIQAVLGTS